MKNKSTLAMLVAAIIFAAFSWAMAAQTSPAPSVSDQLKAQYTMAKLDRDGTGLKVVGAGTVLVVQKTGILGVPSSSITMAPSKYQDGVLHSPGGGARMFLGNNTRFFDVGEKVYATKMDINVKGDKVSFTIVDCDACNGTALSYKTVVIFQFPQGYLAKAELAQIQDVIGQVLSPDTGAANAAAQGPGPQQAQPQMQDTQPAQAEPQTVKLGQTVEEIQATLGQPLKTANVGTKLIYVYKDLKVTFVDGKVADVQ